MHPSQELRNEISSEIYAKFFHGLANPTRFKIALSLLDKEKNVSELVEELQLKQSQVSNQLACLKWCGYVDTRQEGKYVYYQIKDERVKQIILLASELVRDNAKQISECTRIKSW
ncbi:metalloregulator ArsR/SmtB family transcription factor [Cytobacillus sp. S13-E01]|uniref:ArsR/SmtB family transcription factor n=1 Tax=Cytobacillus sp. S13-E01 TaxID=3031326 RepID=UPI0023D80BCC|nr:metalloregulator ArsR/SmtB family transcription factor [Cytobacillus sp. S13-E01]MDF0727732.1 metalloregulator ArsR/SmtB family transcription factor [Cytobacillus sp. S13-E01]